MKRFLSIGLVIFAALLLPVKSVFAAPRVQQTDETIVIVIDPGHGGENEGTKEGQNYIGEEAVEKSMTLITAQAMYEELSLYDNVEVYLTRTDDRDLSLEERAGFAADVGADFLFSIHYNASVEHDLFGTEVWISAQTPYNGYGWQFGAVQMQNMQNLGLFLRGVKTRLSENPNTPDSDYYGIIREAVGRGVPAVIIEHCHVDQEKDLPFCTTEEDWKAFGRADALSAAKYFGLKSAALGVDYSADSANLPEASAQVVVQSSLKDITPPDVCEIEAADIDYEAGKLSLTVSAADYDSPLLYYDYSIDGGKTYTGLEPWPGSNALAGTYTDTFTLHLEIPDGVMPSVILRAYNLFDVFAKSNVLQSFQVFGPVKDNKTADSADEDALAEKDGAKSGEEKTAESNKPGTTTFWPAMSEETAEEKEADFLVFLKICLLFVILLFFFVLVSQYLTYRAKKRRRRRSQKK